jgi:hypothetical protein
MLLIAFCILRDGTEYIEPGGDYVDRLHLERTRNRLIRRFQRLGLDVILKPRTDSPADPPVSPPVLEKRGRTCKCAEAATVALTAVCLDCWKSIRPLSKLPARLRLAPQDSFLAAGQVTATIPAPYGGTMILLAANQQFLYESAYKQL